MSLYPTPKELAEETQRLFDANPMTPKELFEFLVREGIIDRQGRVLCNRLFGEDDQEPARAPTSPTTGGVGSLATNGATAPTPAPADAKP